MPCNYSTSLPNHSTQLRVLKLAGDTEVDVSLPRFQTTRLNWEYWNDIEYWEGANERSSKPLDSTESTETKVGVPFASTSAVASKPLDSTESTETQKSRS